MDVLSILATLKGWRTMIIAAICGGAAAVIGAVQIMDWAPVLSAALPDVPGWIIALTASFVGGALRVITTTPMGVNEHPTASESDQ